MGPIRHHLFPATLRPTSKTSRAVLAALTMALLVFSGGFGNIFHLPGQKFLPPPCRGALFRRGTGKFLPALLQRVGKKFPSPRSHGVPFLPPSAGTQEVYIPSYFITGGIFKTNGFIPK